MNDDKFERYATRGLMIGTLVLVVITIIMFIVLVIQIIG